MKFFAIVSAVMVITAQILTAQQIINTQDVDKKSNDITLDAFLALNAYMPKNSEMIAYFDFAKLARSGAFAKAEKSFTPDGAAKLMPDDLDFQFMLAVPTLSTPEPVAAFYASEWINIDGMLKAMREKEPNKSGFFYQNLPMYVADGTFIASPASHVFIVGDNMKTVYRNTKLKPEQRGGFLTPHEHLKFFDINTFAYIHAASHDDNTQTMTMLGRCNDTHVVIDFQMHPVSDNEISAMQAQITELVGTLAVRLEEAVGVPGMAYDLASRVRAGGGNGVFRINIVLPAELFERYVPKFKLDAIKALQK